MMLSATAQTPASYWEKSIHIEIEEKPALFGMRLVTGEGTHPSGRIAPARFFDFENLRTEIGENPGAERTGDAVRHVQDLNLRQEFLCHVFPLGGTSRSSGGRLAMPAQEVDSRKRYANTGPVVATILNSCLSCDSWHCIEKRRN